MVCTTIDLIACVIKGNWTKTEVKVNMESHDQ